jgi:hypothetical protein
LAFTDKFQYLLGATDAILEAAPGKYSKYFDVQSSLTFGEFVNAIDRFYKEPENLPIPIVWAARVVTMRTNGATEKELDQVVSSMRRQAIKKSKLNHRRMVAAGPSHSLKSVTVRQFFFEKGPLSQRIQTTDLYS